MPAPEREHQNCIITISHVCIASVSMYTGTLSAVYRKIIGCTNSSMILHSSSTVQRRAHRHQSYQSQLNMWVFLENLFTYFFSTWIPCVQFYSLFILYFFFFFLHSEDTQVGSGSHIKGETKYHVYRASHTGNIRSSLCCVCTEHFCMLRFWVCCV